MSSLISSTWDFLKRNRGKLLIGSTAIGGFILLNRYLSSWENEWQKSSSRDFVSQVKKKEIHFENTIETCNKTCMSLSGKIVDILDVTLDAEPILDAIKGSDENKHNPEKSKIQLWHELKIRIFTRVISEVYCLVLFVAYLRVQLAILAGYIYVDSSLGPQSGSSNSSSNSSVQNKYLSLLHTFYQDGIQQIIEPVNDAVEHALGAISLKEMLVLQDLKNVFNEVKASMTFVLSGSNSNASRFLLNPNKLFVNENNAHPAITGKDAQVLQRMLNETQDILESNDFRRVLDAGIDIGFALVMDMLLGCFVRIEDEKRDKNDSGFSNPHSIQVPLAKLLPKIWMSLNERKKQEEKLVLVRHLICLDLLNCFAANIYEAFCENNDKN